MRRRSVSSEFEAPSLVPLADMLTNTVGIMLFILVFAVLTAGTAGITHTVREHGTAKKRIMVVCRHDRAFWVDFDRIKSAVIAAIGEPSPEPAWAARLANLNLTNQAFKIKGKPSYRAGSDIIQKGWIYFLPTVDSYGDPVQSGSTHSVLNDHLQTLNGDQEFVYFLVYPDGIDVYDRAKDLVESKKIETGWGSMATDEKMNGLIWSVANDEGMQMVPND